MSTKSATPRDPAQIMQDMQHAQGEFMNLVFQDCPAALVDQRVAELERRMHHVVRLCRELLWAREGKATPGDLQ